MRTGPIVALAILIVIILIVGWKITRNPAPVIEFTAKVKGIGASTPIQFEVRDSRYTIKKVQVELRQEGRAFTVPYHETIFGEVPPWWKFWGGPKENSWAIMAHAGHHLKFFS